MQDMIQYTSQKLYNLHILSEKTEAQGAYGLPPRPPRGQEFKLAFQPGLCGSGAYQGAWQVFLVTTEPWLPRG